MKKWMGTLLVALAALGLIALAVIASREPAIDVDALIKRPGYTLLDTRAVDFFPSQMDEQLHVTKGVGLHAFHAPKNQMALLIQGKDSLTVSVDRISIDWMGAKGLHEAETLPTPAVQPTGKGGLIQFPLRDKAMGQFFISFYLDGKQYFAKFGYDPKSTVLMSQADYLTRVYGSVKKSPYCCG